jgi:hypothetical protein
MNNTEDTTMLIPDTPATHLSPPTNGRDTVASERK